MMIEHTEKCLAAREKERIELAEYEKRWPGYCRKCGAQGYVKWSESRGECHGVPCSETMMDACEHCIAQGKCPRCGVIDKNNFELEAVMVGDEKAECFICGWKEGIAGAPEVLNPYDCGCYEDALDAVQQN